MPTITRNTDALRNYVILEELEAGMVLTGQEVKSAKGNALNLRGSYATIRANELWLVNAHIAPYPHAAVPSSYNPNRDRKLLLKKREVATLIGKLKSAGLTIVPISVYTKSGLLKVRLGLGRGKKKSDRRASIKKRDIERRLRKAVRRRS